LDSLKISHEEVVNTINKYYSIYFEELNQSFPFLFQDNTSILNYYSKLKEKTSLQQDQILNDTDNEKRIDTLNNYISEYKKVFTFTGYGDHKKHDDDFRKLCAVLNKDSVKDVSELSTFDFHAILSTRYDTSK